jgi:hypothetical protein
MKHETAGSRERDAGEWERGTQIRIRETSRHKRNKSSKGNRNLKTDR